MPSTTFNARLLGETLPELNLAAEIPDLSGISTSELGKEFISLAKGLAPRLEKSDMMWDGVSSRSAQAPLRDTHLRVTRDRYSMSETGTTLKIAGPRTRKGDSVRFSVRDRWEEPTGLSLAFQTSGSKKKPDFLFLPLLGINATDLRTTRGRGSTHTGLLEVRDGDENNDVAARRVFGVGIIVLRNFEPQSFRLVDPRPNY